MGDKLPRDDFLRRARQLVRALVVEQRDLVVVGADRVLREVGDDQRHLLAAALGLGVLRAGSRLSAAKPTQNGGRGRAATHAEDVRVGHELELELRRRSS